VAEAAELLEGVLALAMAAAVAVAFVWPLFHRKLRERPRAQGDGPGAWAAYRSAARWSPDPSRAFRGATAEILRRAEFGPDGGTPVGDPASVHVHARNAHGTCFFVIARADGTVFVKPMGAAAARALVDGS
jgi:hypothetical protein